MHATEVIIANAVYDGVNPNIYLGQRDRGQRRQELYKKKLKFRKNRPPISYFGGGWLSDRSVSRHEAFDLCIYEKRRHKANCPDYIKSFHPGTSHFRDGLHPNRLGLIKPSGKMPVWADDHVPSHLHKIRRQQDKSLIAEQLDDIEQETYEYLLECYYDYLDDMDYGDDYDDYHYDPNVGFLDEIWDDEEEYRDYYYRSSIF